MSKRIITSIAASIMALAMILGVTTVADAKPRPKAKVVKVTKAKAKAKAVQRTAVAAKLPASPPSTCPATTTPPPVIVTPGWGTRLNYVRTNTFPTNEPNQGQRASVGYRGPYVVFTLVCDNTVTQFVYQYASSTYPTFP